MTKTQWLFERPARLWGGVAAVVAVSMVVLMVVLAVKVDRLGDSIPRPSEPSGLAVPTGDERGGTVPDPTAGRTPLATADQGGEGGPTKVSSPTEPAFVDAGDPEPRVLAAVDAWRLWQFDTLNRWMLPSAQEDAIGNPPGVRAGDLKVTGVAAVVEPGPSQAVVEVPTNKGTLLVDVVISEGKWFVASLGWA